MLHRTLPLALLIAPLCPTAASQTVVDDPDVELAFRFMSDQRHSARMIDMESTRDGYLIVAFVELVPNRGDDRIVIVQRDLGGQWTLISNHAYGFDHVIEMSMTVPERGDGNDPVRDRVYVVAQFATDAGLGQDIEHVGLVSGPWLTPWSNPGRLEFVHSNLPQVPPRRWADWNPVVACVPAGPGDFSDHVVEVAFAYPDNASGSEMSVFRSQSFDYGRNLSSAVKIAGPGATGTFAPELQGTNYRNPSLCSDSRTGTAVVAIEDGDAGVIRIVSAYPRSTRMDLVASSAGASLAGGQQVEILPTITADDGALLMTYLGRPKSGGFSGLYVAQAHSLTGSFQRLGQIHPRVATPGDVDIREGTAYIAARFYLDNVWPQTPVLQVWEGSRYGSMGTRTSVADRSNECIRPRIAVSQDGPAMQSVGYTTRDWFMRNAWRLGGGEVRVDL